MQVVINVEKRHLVVFSMFLVVLGSLFVIAQDTNENNNPGHSADDIGGGNIEGAVSIYKEDNNINTCSDDPLDAGASPESMLFINTETSGCNYGIRIKGDLFVEGTIFTDGGFEQP